MPRHAHYLPHGVIPAVLLPFSDDLAIDEKGFRKHLRDVAATDGISAVTINAHSTEVASCSFEEQRRVLAITQDEIGDRLPIVNGIWADGSLEAARIARMAEEGGASALLVFPPAPFTLQQSPAMAVEHFKRIADAYANHHANADPSFNAYANADCHRICKCACRSVKDRRRSAVFVCKQRIW